MAEARGPASQASAAQAAAGEFFATAMLILAVVGSGLHAQRLTSDIALALLANTIITAAALVAMILAFGPISGAHANPVVSVLAWRRGELPGRRLPACSTRWRRPGR